MPGIIPALAGNTGIRPASWSCGADHPRSRGEYGCGVFGGEGALGSSPLSRGIQHPDRLGLPGNGIIPALAGNTVPAPSQQPPRPDHPRSRGEYGHETAAADMAAGSSPLSRGIPVRVAWSHVTSRIIPALAGNTFAHASISTSKTDHPRSRGEYTTRQGHPSPQMGSSPLSRGIRRQAREGRRLRRIIPALAGNTRLRRRGCWRRRDHPRSRGEYP